MSGRPGPPPEPCAAVPPCATEPCPSGSCPPEPCSPEPCLPDPWPRVRPQVNVTVAVDVIGALSERTLLGGHLCLVDDSGRDGDGQGTAQLCTHVRPGQVVQWSVVPVDVQTPVEIRNIVFPAAGAEEQPASPPAESAELALDVWSGVVPEAMPRGVRQHYRLELQMSEGESSVLYVDGPSLLYP